MKNHTPVVQKKEINLNAQDIVKSKGSLEAAYDIIELMITNIEDMADVTEVLFNSPEYACDNTAANIQLNQAMQSIES